MFVKAPLIASIIRRFNEVLSAAIVKGKTRNLERKI